MKRPGINRDEWRIRFAMTSAFTVEEEEKRSDSGWKIFRKDEQLKKYMHLANTSLGTD